MLENINFRSRNARKTLKILELLLFLVGIGLIGTFAAYRTLAYLRSQAAIGDFMAAGGSESQSGPGQVEKVDHSLWSVNRIRAYEQSLVRDFPPPVAVLEIARIGLKVPVFPSAEDEILDRGAGWIPGTAEPGHEGNVGIAGHRDGFFRGLKDIQLGDVLELVLAESVETYRVDGTEIVDPSAVWVLQPRGVDAITLVTCYPFYFVGSAPQRFIVKGTLVKRASRTN